MKVQILQENLNHALSLISRVVNNKVDLPILANILITADKNNLILSATNLETSMVIKSAAKVEKEGKITLPAKTFQEIILSLPAEKLTLEQEGEKVKITCGKTFVQINGLSAEEFPIIPQIQPKAEGWKMKGEVLTGICTQVAFAASTDESRPVLNGVLFKPEKEQLSLVATDGYRLSKKEIKGSFQEGSFLLIPARSLLEVGRIVREKDEEITIVPDKKQNQVIFLTADVQVVSRLIEGEFPPFAKIIPASCQTTVVLDKEELTHALKTAGIFARESANIIKLKVQNSQPKAGRPLAEKIKISANAPQVGENEAELEAKIKGEEVEIAFNFRFLQEFLNAVEGEEVAIKINDSLSPAIFSTPGDSSFFHVIMPVRVQPEAAE